PRYHSAVAIHSGSGGCFSQAPLPWPWPPLLLPLASRPPLSAKPSSPPPPWLGLMLRGRFLTPGCSSYAPPPLGGPVPLAWPPFGGGLFAGEEEEEEASAFRPLECWAARSSELVLTPVVEDGESVSDSSVSP
ncbi:unnamed protein product, partial [Ectocarpus sp. 12 AP-2014]